MKINYYFLIIYFSIGNASYSMHTFAQNLLGCIGAGCCLTSLYLFYDQTNLLKKLNSKYPDMHFNMNFNSTTADKNIPIYNITVDQESLNADDINNNYNQYDQRLKTIPLAYYTSCYALMMIGIGSIYLNHKLNRI